MIDYNCTECRERIRPANLVTGSGTDEAIVCDCCEEYACHIRCLDEVALAEFRDNDDEWLCDLCEAILEQEDGPCLCSECLAEHERMAQIVRVREPTALQIGQA